MNDMLLIKGGTIVDGSGSDPYKGDILIKGDKIEEIGSFNRQYKKVINADGCYITPGFIDMHSHTDLMNLVREGLKPKIMQGVTTEVVGQCGLGVAPVPEEKRKEFRENLIIGDQSVDWRWESTGDYLKSLEKHGLESNLVPFTGHGVLRYAVKGNEYGSLDNNELKEMEELLEEAFSSGVFGISFGLVYLPAIFSDIQELKKVVNITSKYKGIIAVHLRSEGDELVEAINEMITLVENNDARLHISHLKAIGEKNWPLIDQILSLVEEKNLTFDHYPYTAGSTTLLAIFPLFILQGKSMEDMLENLKRPEIRKRVKQIFSGKEKVDKGLPWDNIPALVGWGNIKIIDLKTEQNKEFLGMSILEIANKLGKDPADTAIDLIIEEKGNVRMIDFYLNEDTLVKIMKHPQGMFGTDSLFGGGVPHPRGFGTYPRIISKYVFNNKDITLENAVAKMTSKPADVLGLSKRGLVKPGYYADLVIFDDNFSDCATYENPTCYPSGIHYVFINGKEKVNKGKYVKGFQGRVIRRR